MLEPEHATVCGVCGKHTCDGCRRFLYKISPTLDNGAQANAWGVCPGNNAADEGERHVYRPFPSRSLAALIIGLTHHKQMYCLACRTSSDERLASGAALAATAGVPSGMNYAEWLVHQLVCPFMRWVCPSRCGFFGDQVSVTQHMAAGICHCLPMTIVGGRGSVCGEIRVFPEAGYDMDFLPSTVVNLPHCDSLRTALPLITVENKGADSACHLNVATCLPPSVPLMVTVKATVWPLDQVYYRPGAVSRFSSERAARGPLVGRAVKIHRVEADGRGTRDFCMDAGVNNIEGEFASLDRELLKPAYMIDVAQKTDRPTRTIVVQGIIPARSQVICPLNNLLLARNTSNY